MSERRYDVLVVGAGPAGLAAARRAAESGASVAVVDDNPQPGGQIWRALPVPAKWQAGAGVLCGASVVAFPRPGAATLETFRESFDLSYGRLVLATGARERFLPFPGWTLPHVTGAGGLQALAKSGLPVEGKRVVVAGTGPLLLAVADYLRRHGAHVPFIAEQAPRAALLRFTAHLARHPAKLVQAARFAGLRVKTSCWPVSAHPGGIVLRQDGATWTEPCDLLACGFGLIPNTELAALLGCRIHAGGVAVDEFQQTTVSNVYAAGEVTGIGGLDLSLLEGEIAGYAAAGKRDTARRLFPARHAQQTFAAALDRAFTLRPELRNLAADDTIVCRCEDVPLGRLRTFNGWREAKLHTRCGMGPCQGRVCGGATSFLFGWHPESVRPPAMPARIESLMRD